MTDSGVNLAWDLAFVAHGITGRLVGDGSAMVSRVSTDSREPMEGALLQQGMNAKAARSEVTALFAHAVGLLVLDHSGRMRMFGQDSRRLFDAYLDALEARAQLHAHAASAAEAPGGLPSTA